MNQTAICNLALLRIGISQPISDIAENSVAARACNAVWDQCIRTMVRERPWPFATRQVDLALVGEQLFQEWLYTYRYPTDYLNIHRVRPISTVTSTTLISAFQTQALPQTYPYAIGSDDDGKLIHTNVEDAVCVGTVFVEDTGQFDPLFTSALAWFLAAEIALSLTKSRDIYANAFGMYQQVSSEAFATSVNEPKPDVSPDADMIEARA
jgi:hypothetical protein